MNFRALLRHIVGVWTFEDYRNVDIKLINANGFKKKLLKLKQRKIGYRRGIEIENWANIGENLVLAHPHGIIVNQRARIGNNVTLYQNVTIGEIASGKREGAPTICDNVTIFPGAVVVGGITVGEGARISPNTFVNFDVPAGALVLGNPGEIIHKQ